MSCYLSIYAADLYQNSLEVIHDLPLVLSITCQNSCRTPLISPLWLSRLILLIQVAQRSTLQRFVELQSINSGLQRELSQARLQLTKIAEEKEAAVLYEKKRIADRLQRRPERNRAFKVTHTSAAEFAVRCTLFSQKTEVVTTENKSITNSLLWTPQQH